MSKKYEILAVLILLGLGVWYLYPLTAEERYAKYHKLWKSHDIKRYAYTLVGLGSAQGPVYSRIVVNNNKIVSHGKGPAYTIDDKFESIYNEAHLNQTSYNSIYGYPKHDKSYLAEGMLGGYFFTIENFRVLSENTLNRESAVCAKYIILDPMRNTLKPLLQKAYNKTYKNRDMMDMEGAYFEYEGVCKDEDNETT